ncbi:hypothetical protein TNCV_1803701 [Trichonephila clavipes]|uniref:Uncharacterized protein n=1 Tax=Trichonephila clavipes TaxID=2585209 RepID=A0A8X6SGY8_TRICX|nr:hypothetical protein TNCV_1803701 [Trichonephila clavipes]
MPAQVSSGIQLASGPIRENYSGQDKESALGFLCEKSQNKTGCKPDFRDREPIPELQIIKKKTSGDSGYQLCLFPAPSLSQAKLNFDLLVVK